MGRRKSKRKPPSKKKAIQPLDTQFNCPFCNHEKSCEVKMYVKLKCYDNFTTKFYIAQIKIFFFLITGINQETQQELHVEFV